MSNLRNTVLWNKIIVDNYGNYVIQKALKVAAKKEDPAFNRILNLVLENIRLLDQKDYGRKLIKKLSNTYPEVKRFVNKYRRKHHQHNRINKLE